MNTYKVQRSVIIKFFIDNILFELTENQEFNFQLNLVFNTCQKILDKKFFWKKNKINFVEQFWLIVKQTIILLFSLYKTK